MAQESYCLDVFFDGGEILRENLIELLKKERKNFDFDVSKGQCGNWEEVPLLRILTPHAKTLTEYILRNIKGSEDYSYDEYYAKEKAENSKFWDKEKNKNKPFDFIESYFNYNYKIK